VATSFDPDAWEALTDLRERHARRARELDEIWRRFQDGDATEQDFLSAREREQQAYQAWVQTRVPGGARDDDPDPDLGLDGEIPHDV